MVHVHATLNLWGMDKQESPSLSELFIKAGQLQFDIERFKAYLAVVNQQINDKLEENRKAAENPQQPEIFNQSNQEAKEAKPEQV